jgi:3-hydroxyisobutyrate dehydrogenase-like beta-hydroxyacid dehydrogenase
MDVAVIGQGQMGSGMARQLLKAGHRVTVYNRSRERAQALEADGARVAATLGEAAATATVAITMLADDEAVESAVLGPDGLLQALPAGGIHLAMSTISVALCRRLAAAHAGRGQVMVAAPVFGRPQAAASGQLFILAAGPGDAVARSGPLLEAMGQRTFPLGEDPAAAAVTKLAGNFLIGAMIEGLGESVALVRKHGLSASAFIDILTSTLFAAPVYKGYGAMIAEQRYQPPGFRLPLGLKDLRLVLAAADAAQVPMPLASLVRDQTMSAMGRGHGELDWAALAEVAAENAGLPMPER